MLRRCSRHLKHDFLSSNTSTVLIGLLYVAVRDGTYSLGTGHRANQNFRTTWNKGIIHFIYDFSSLLIQNNSLNIELTNIFSFFCIWHDTEIIRVISCQFNQGDQPTISDFPETFATSFPNIVRKICQVWGVYLLIWLSYSLIKSRGICRYSVIYSRLHPEQLCMRSKIFWTIPSRDMRFSLLCT